MSARRCFTGKLAAGVVSERAGKRLLDMLDELERDAKGDAERLRKAAIAAAIRADFEAARKADLARRQIIAEGEFLSRVRAVDATVTELRETPGDFWGLGTKAPAGFAKETRSTVVIAAKSLLARDITDVATALGNNVDTLARTLKGEAHALFAQTMDYLKAKKLGFEAQTVRELDFLRAVHGQRASPEGIAAAAAWDKAHTPLIEAFNAAGGDVTLREKYFPNPWADPTKIRAAGADRVKEFLRPLLDRSQMRDRATGAPLSDAAFERVLDQVLETWRTDGLGDAPSSGFAGQRMLANRRGDARVLAFRGADEWLQFAQAFGVNASPFHVTVSHIDRLANNVAQLRMLGPNPASLLRLMQSTIDREPARLAVEATDLSPESIAAATKQNRKLEAQAARDKKALDNLYAEVSGTNSVPVDGVLAQRLGDVRHWLQASQLGSAIISSWTDAGTLAMTARLNGLPVTQVMHRATRLMADPQMRVFAAQQGLVADTLARVVGDTDRVMGETIRLGLAAKVSNAVIRASGLARWTDAGRYAFGLEYMAHVARERGKAFADLAQEFRAGLARYGINEAEWDTIRNTAPHEPRPDALFTRPMDVADRAVAEKYAHLIYGEMDHAIIENDPVTRAMLIGDSRPGTYSGELRRAISMYRMFPGSFLMFHWGRGLSRGWDGSRLGHLGVTMGAMTLFGALSMQAKEIIQGRSPLSLDPSDPNGRRAWGKAILQGGGLGAFGDIFFIDKTRLDNSWASTFAGPQFGAVEDVLGKFLFKNVQLAIDGKPTHFVGDALYTAGRFVPGSTLWYARTAFQRGVLDQLALMADDRARQRFARMEQNARENFGQQYWWRPGHAVGE